MVTNILLQASSGDDRSQRRLWRRRRFLAVCAAGFCICALLAVASSGHGRSAPRRPDFRRFITELETARSIEDSGLVRSSNGGELRVPPNAEQEAAMAMEPSFQRRPARKLLTTGRAEASSPASSWTRDDPSSRSGKAGNYSLQMERIGDGSCTMDDIAIFQGETGPLPNGIPSFTVQIFNLCLGGCAMEDIHVSCGWFASATLVNPKLFKRLSFDDCIVNAGKPLHPGDSLTFHYANSFQYPFSVHTAVHVPCAKGPGH